MDSTLVSRFSRVSALAAGLLLTTGFAAGCSGASSTAGSASSSGDSEALSSIPQHATRPLCTTSLGQLGYQCLATVVTDTAEGYTPDFGAVADAFTPNKTKPASVAYGPSDLQSAYGIPSGGEGVTVAVINAEDDPNAEADLAVYRAKYGLPACTTANGCFKKVNGTGQASPLPGGEYDTAAEITLDLDAVSAGCPKCNILLVEAELNNQPDSAGVLDPFGAAVDAAVNLGATFISISYGTPEATSTANGGVLKADALAQASHYNHPGVSIFVSTGDSGFATSPNNSSDRKGPQFPSDVPTVFAVGGTSLAKTTTNSRGWAEGVWGPGGTDGAGNSGCSEFFPKPSYQTSTACIGREISDVSAVADPATGFNIYITYVDPDASAEDHIPSGWNVFGGTSLASPLTASIFAASGLVGVDPSFAYKNASDFNDVTTGSNGTCKEFSLCNARAGYDAPSGNGTPNGALLDGK